MRQGSSQRAVTLTELILSILLLTVVILTGLSMELGMRRIIGSTDAEALLLAEAGPIMTLATKAILRAMGSNATTPPLSYAASGFDENFTIQTDSNIDGVLNASDRSVRFRFRGDYVSPRPRQLWFYKDSTSSNYAMLSDRVVSFNISMPANGVSNITMTMRMNSTNGSLVSVGNPEITLRSAASYRSATP